MGQARGDRRRRELLEAALRVIGTDGPKAVAHRSVAAEAGVPLGATTYYFSSKDEILVEALRFAARTEMERLERDVEAFGTEQLPPGDWAEMVAAWLDRQLSGRARSRTIALYSLQLEAVHRPELRAVYEEWTVATVRLAERLLAAAGATDPHARAPVLVAALDGLRHNQLATRDQGAAAPVVRAVVEPLLGLLLAADPHVGAPAS